MWFHIVAYLILLLWCQNLRSSNESRGVNSDQSLADMLVEHCLQEKIDNDERGYN